eukprot:9497951-Pyramimonas_sp.AAC.1
MSVCKKREGEGDGGGETRVRSGREENQNPKRFRTRNRSQGQGRDFQGPRIEKIRTSPVCRALVELGLVEPGLVICAGGAPPSHFH